MSLFKDKNNQTLTLQEAYPKIINRLVNYWVDFELMILRLVGDIPSHIFRRSVYRLAGLKIGGGSVIHMWANLFQPKNIIIGKDTIVGDHCFLDGRVNITIGDHTDIASQVLIYNSKHDINDPEFRAVEAPVKIGDYVFIGPRVIIMPGITINNGAVVAAGAVVTHDVPAGKIVAGVPAKIIGERELTDFHYRLGRARLFQ